ncbi:TetR/AcrR family transcriptional regulator [Streptomyces sp. NPDC059909]|uniref:TetR/AcrR family transcriptional regulator n=1 Tax=Streptomyces sp. NPDC059909 TaxID=3346998 RepID=UPI00365EC0B1
MTADEQGTGRKYEMRRRADAVSETRNRITGAAIQLHGTVGPARTTIAGIASLAGVQRHTVYRHFPTEEELFTACSTEYWQRNPWPDTAKWQDIPSPGERTVGALGDLYRFYDAVEPMLANVLKDGDHIPGIKPSVDAYEAKIDAITHVLIAGYSPAPATLPTLTAAVRHAAAFSTWQSLVRANGLKAGTAAALMAALLQTAAQPLDGLGAGAVRG